jgi:hypothetical protein
MKRGTKRALAGAVIIACLTLFVLSGKVRYVTKALAFTAIYGFSMAADQREAETIKETILKSYKFPRSSILDPSRPPVFCSAGSHWLLTRPAEFFIYGIADKAEQEKITGAVQETIVQRIHRPVILNFLAQENLREISGSRVAYSRGDERLLIAIRIDSDGESRVIKRDAIQNYHPQT